MPCTPSLSFRAVAVLTGAIAFPGLAFAQSAENPSAQSSEEIPAVAVVGVNSNNAPQVEREPSSESVQASVAPGGASGTAGEETINLDCLSRTICEIKQKIRWQTAAWSPAQCQKVARAVLESSEKYQLSPTLLLAVMINESDLNEKSARVSTRDNKVYAKDSGLMAVRCVVDSHDRCVNSNLQGVKWTQLMDPATNIAVGARELAHWRDGGAYVRKTVKVRDRDGHVRPVLRNVPCRHKDHGFWAHYNHGPRYIDHGYARHYPHRVAVIDHALASVFNVDAPELHQKRITVRDPGRGQRTADRPQEARYKKLCSQIRSVHACSAVAMN